MLEDVDTFVEKEKENQEWQKKKEEMSLAMEIKIETMFLMTWWLATDMVGAFGNVKTVIVDGTAITAMDTMSPKTDGMEN